MKATVSIFLSIAILLTMTACDISNQANSNNPSTQPTTTADPTTVTEHVTAPTENTVPTEPTESATEPSLSAELPYLQKINRADQHIYNGPGYDYNQTGTVKESGTYTIVEEYADDEGNLWGKLKSGAGWVDLTQINEENTNPPLVTISIPDKTLLQSGNYHHCIVNTSEYMVQVALRVREPVSQVALYEVIFNGDNESLLKVYALDNWDNSMPIVADIAFPGDLSTYEFHVTDSNGRMHRYTIYESGRNGDIELESVSILD